MAAAEAKLDAKIKSLNGLKADVQSLLTQTDAKQQAEIDRLVKVFEGMKAKDAAPRMVALDDSVRIPIASKMKERALSAMLAQMPPQEAKKLTESLARRFAEAQAAAAKASAAAGPPAPAKPPAKQAAAPAAPPAKAG
jgi:flagellar motility protein MotE (MotC chaperone)